MQKDRILLSHGSGGRAMHELIRSLLLKKLNNPVLAKMTDAAVLRRCCGDIAFTTDSFVVSPIFFPGGDIGKLAVCGTVNDLVMSGARPEYISLALIVEEGLEYNILEQIIDSISAAAKRAGVRVATGDFKVVEKGACDKVFINTSGIGKIIRKLELSSVAYGDKVVVTGNIAEHGLAVLARRKGLDLGFNIKSDCASLNKMLVAVLHPGAGVRFMRDPTRGGIATTLNEIIEFCGKGIIVDEESLPVSSKVRVACELLGIDPMYVANEGKAVIIVRKESAARLLRQLQGHPLGRNARIIGQVSRDARKKLVVKTSSGSGRIADMLVGEPLPRIC